MKASNAVLMMRVDQHSQDLQTTNEQLAAAYKKRDDLHSKSFQIDFLDYFQIPAIISLVFILIYCLMKLI